jgi:protein-S-isoprenylcysteine O-methyltransferase Ste14
MRVFILLTALLQTSAAPQQHEHGGAPGKLGTVHFLTSCSAAALRNRFGSFFSAASYSASACAGSFIATRSLPFRPNPMYLGAALAMGGAALFYQSAALLSYIALFLLVTHLFVTAYEEPTLRQTFGIDYKQYCARVGRWWPGWPD